MGFSWLNTVHNVVQNIQEQIIIILFLKELNFRANPMYILKRQYFVGRSIFYNTVNYKKLHQNENNGDIKFQSIKNDNISMFAQRQYQVKINTK